MLRQIKDLDRKKIYGIIEEEFGYKYTNDSPFTNWLIYEDNGKLSFINYDSIYDKAELLYIYVDSLCRNKGVATNLLKEMIKDLDKKNIKEISLEVNETNTKAINFYEKNNFKEISRRENYYGPNDAIIMFRSW